MVSSSVQSRLHHGPSSGKSIAWPTGLHCAPDDTDELLRWKKTESVVGKRSLRLEAKQLSIYIYIIYICYVYIYILYYIYVMYIYIYFICYVYICYVYIYYIIYMLCIYILYVMYIYVMYMYVYIHVCICIYTCMYMYIYTYVYIYMYRFNEWAICKAWRNDLDLPWRANWANFSSLPLVSPGLTRSHQVAAESSGQCRRPRPAWCSPHQKPQTEPGSKATEGTGGQGPQRWCHENMRDFKWSA